MGFQKYANSQPAPAEAGDFAGTNPRMSTSGGPGSYTAAANIPATFGEAVPSIPAFVVGRMAWAEPNNGDVNNTQGSQGEAPASVAHNYFTLLSLLGFVHRENQAIIVAFLQESLLSVQPGLPANLMAKGDFWASFPAGATAGQKVYADALTGETTAAAAGSGVDFAITASLANTGVLTVTATSGVLAVGQVVTGTGVPAGTFITAQLSGSAGSTGTYQLNRGVTLGSRAMHAYETIETPWYVTTSVVADVTATGSIVAATGILTTTGGSAATIAEGDLITGAGIPAGARIVRQLTGSPGDNGTYQTNVFVHITSEDVVIGQGKVAKISQWQTA
jgi:hypothetical protein